MTRRGPLTPPGHGLADNLQADTYTITEAEAGELFTRCWFYHGERTEARLFDGRVIVLNVPLCGQCDKPWSECDGKCCDPLAIEEAA